MHVCGCALEEVIVSVEAFCVKVWDASCSSQCWVLPLHLPPVGGATPSQHDECHSSQWGRGKKEMPKPEFAVGWTGSIFTRCLGRDVTVPGYCLLDGMQAIVLKADIVCRMVL